MNRVLGAIRYWYTGVLLRLDTEFLMVPAGLIAVCGVEIIGLPIVSPTATLAMVAAVLLIRRVRRRRHRV
ncbi:hypothetical protein HFP15_06845 [Amycolatopsis sp. K13G38]|uniref:Uncharacterized protein n=1 Tax=Amycolatopsis acididurans TaxID=2724524 RepID=A0ABX1J2N5_9PSEU|nr:hypothetical protein [Amycolatopsis acididurans]NKQ52595.1 hypothetical protein [Amycolatopsis acididurans]